jgi:adenylate cyclase
MNPRFCGFCEKWARTHPGGAELQMALLFADIRGSTPLAETLGAAAFSRLIDRFYKTATDVLIGMDAWIDRLVGDEVVAMFLPGVSGADYAQRTVRAALNLLWATGHGDPQGPWVPVGVGLHAGVAFVGTVGSPEGVVEFTVLGDAPNLTARLASTARSGEVLLTEALRAAVGLEVTQAGLEPRLLDLKGKSEAVQTWSLRVGTPTPAPAP